MWICCYHKRCVITLLCLARKVEPEADFQFGCHCCLFIMSYDPWKDDCRVILVSKDLRNTMRKAFCDGCVEMEAPSGEGGACIHGAANLWAVGAVEVLSKLHNDMGQIALDGYWHGLLERTSSGQNCNVNNKDVIAMTASAAAPGTSLWGKCTWSCKQWSNTCSIPDFATGHGLEHLLSNALLARFIKVRKICRPKVLPLLALRVTLLAILAHPVDILGGIIQKTRIILFWAQNHMFTVPIFRPWVWAATAKARVQTHLPLRLPPWGSLDKVFIKFPTSWRLTCKCLLCLIRKGACTITCAASNECLW